MEELLPFYERELAFLRKYAKEFSSRYPKVAGRLLLSGDVSQDPHVERLIESFALLNARVAKKIEDDYPEFTDALLEVLYPHYLRPFPACSIARLDIGSAAGQLSKATTIPRGTELRSAPVKNVPCRFRTAYDVTLGPLELQRAAFEPVAQPPRAVRTPADATGQISLTFHITSEQARAATLGIDDLRLFIDGEPSFSAALRDALSMYALKAYAEADRHGEWVALDEIPIKPVGFDESEGLIDYPRRSHPAFRLLTEFFAFPDKFNFVDIDFAALMRALPSDTRIFTLHLLLTGVRSDSGIARTLEGLSAESLLTGCTPVVNLFPQRGEPIRVSETASSYPVVADARRAYAYEVVSVESVKRVRQTPQGESVTVFRPFYSLQHGADPESAGHYWVMSRDEMVARTSPGYEYELTLVDLNFEPVKPHTDTLSVALTCTNRDLPERLAYGRPGGDLTLEGGSVVQRIQMLRKPSPGKRFARGRQAHWRLISHLALDHLSLVQGGLETFKEVLRIYDLSRSAISSRQIEGILALDYQPTTTWLSRGNHAAVVRGLEVTLTVDEESFVGIGVNVFAQVIDRFLGFYVHANSFTQLVIVSGHTEEVLLRCHPRGGDSVLA
ncbi:type VI secretion system baseplate subunit TssF [uncultured Salinisphaera sp.]|uniref:type VI secretion system baseplate subunit TssF n=1 Tax=uncultured Salinisphaera sp. TaxID=359372 RepID=UPI0032B2C33A|tara:strand:+ start:686 stop:2530 length:1845 start_codon:yes stop_codon:yes gene_type:complete